MKLRRLSGQAVLLSITLSAHFGSTLRAEEDLAGPPITTAKAWAIADANTGKVLESFQPDLPLKSASTTKVMCAYVVLELARQDPGVLEEMVTISKLADATTGSTADMRAGEKVSVHEGLFGLLLPSGNDMGNALAEHFHSRLQPPGEDAPPSIMTAGFKSRRNFIAEMNRTAARLGMSRTIYRQSYGDGGTDKERTTTARDLITVGYEAMKNPLFREIVHTQAYTGKAIKPDGKIRKAEWENSNQLLKLGGYIGIKTGTTDLAGYCLLSAGEQNGMPLMIAMLGCPTEEVRYAETRNLFRWMWSRPKR